MTELSESRIIDLLNDPPFKVEVFDSIGSTNSYLKDVDVPGGDSYRIACAATQTEGRGRLGRSFSSERGGCYFSFSFVPGDDVSDPRNFTQCVCVAVVSAIKKLTGIKAGIKWVNDVYVGEKKVCGILTEAVTTASGNFDRIICGIGINVDIPAGGFPAELKGTAAALAEFGAVPDVNELIACIINEVRRYAPNYLISRYIDIYRARSCVVGRRVTVIKNGAGYDALAVAINDDGSLLVEYDGTRRESLISGDVSLKIN